MLAKDLLSRGSLLAAEAASLAAIVYATENDKKSKRTRFVRRRCRRSVQEIYQCLGPQYFRRAYRMTYKSFWLLHSKLEDKIMLAIRSIWRSAPVVAYRRKETDKKKYRPPPVPNGVISTSIRLACAIRYFAGGSPYDLMGQYGISYIEVFRSLWAVVEAINTLQEFQISYPADPEVQRQIAAEFESVSGVKFDNCAGAIDGVLIWISKPTEKDSKRSGVSRKKLFCARKGKFGLNMQAVSDRRGRILDMSINYGGSSSDCLAFEASDLYRRLEDGLLTDDLILFGDNAYINSKYMATPFPNVSGGGEDIYNFYHSQVSAIY
jgi:DDE superfamily endonuclease